MVLKDNFVKKYNSQLSVVVGFGQQEKPYKKEEKKEQAACF
jgi:hypothetical protein